MGLGACHCLVLKTNWGRVIHKSPVYQRPETLSTNQEAPKCHPTGERIKQKKKLQSEDHDAHSGVTVTLLFPREAKPMRCRTFIINLSRRPSLVSHTSSILRPLLRKAAIFSRSWWFRVLSSACEVFLKKRNGRFEMAGGVEGGWCWFQMCWT